MDFIKRIMRGYSIKYILSRLDYHYGIGFFERIIFVNWINPIYTLYFNLRCFSLKQAIHIPVLVYGRPKLFCLSGEMKIEGPIRFGMIRFNQTKPLAPSNTGLQSEINNQGLIIFRGKGFIGTGNKIVVAPSRVLELGNDFVISNFCNIACFCGIRIGEHTRIAHRSQILDTNYHFIANFSRGIVPNRERPICIGKYCWICNTSTVAAGSIIPDFTIIASNSLVNRDFSNIPFNSIIGGVPAKFIASGFRRVENSYVERVVDNFYKNSFDEVYSISQEDTMDYYSIVYGI